MRFSSSPTCLPVFIFFPFGLVFWVLTSVCSSQVYSMDMFYSKFKDNPMNGTEGRRYRHAVLEKGGSRDEMSLLEDFLGRKPSTEAFYKELGLD